MKEKMNYKKIYHSPIGNIILKSDGECLTELTFESHCKNDAAEGTNLAIFDETITWLDIYFRGKEPAFTPKLKIENDTPFRSAVREEMLNIPYGCVATYGEIAKRLAQKRGLKRMSAQAVGGAVGANPVCIIIPCHRVVGSNKNLIGYGGGIENKIALLKCEGIDLNDYDLPEKGKKHE